MRALLSCSGFLSTLQAIRDHKTTILLKNFVSRILYNVHFCLLKSIQLLIITINSEADPWSAVYPTKNNKRAAAGLHK
jgi:hypothetical protein